MRVCVTSDIPILVASPSSSPQASIFAQSHVKAHAELTWLLSCTTPISWLNKMIQFKEKARRAVGLGRGNRLRDRKRKEKKLFCC